MGFRSSKSAKPEKREERVGSRESLEAEEPLFEASDMTAGLFVKAVEEEEEEEEEEGEGVTLKSTKRYISNICRLSLCTHRT